MSSEVGLEASACVGLIRPSGRTVRYRYGRILAAGASVNSRRGYGELHALIVKRGCMRLMQVSGLFADVAAHSTPRAILAAKGLAFSSRSGFSLV